MQNDIVFGIVVGLIFTALIVVFCIILLKLYVRKIKNYTAQLYQKDLDFQKTLNATIIETQEHLLHNISQDLHDDAGQQLTYINFQIENLKLDSPELKGSLDPVSQSVAALSKSVRAISHSLNSQMVVQQDLVKAILAEVKRLKKNDRIAFHCHVEDGNARTFDDNLKIVIYRMFQEIINNAIKHSAARNITMSISCSPSFTLMISDDGKGFDQQIKQNENGMGLQNLKNRAAQIGFTIEIDSAPNQGTTITLTETSH